MIELRNITKTFGNVVANDSVSIKIEKGMIHTNGRRKRRGQTYNYIGLML